MTPLTHQGSVEDLLARVEAATGADRELDVRLWAHFDGREVTRKGRLLLAKSSRGAQDQCQIGVFNDVTGFHAAWANPPYPKLTASLDAALALVERVRPGWQGEIQWAANGHGYAALAPKPWAPHHGQEVEDVGGFEAAAPTRPLAVIAALLRTLSGERQG